MPAEIQTKIAVFKGKQVRRIIHNNEWWFSVVDVCAVLSESADAGAYWRKLKQRLREEGSEVVTFCHGLKLPAPEKSPGPFLPSCLPRAGWYCLSCGRSVPLLINGPVRKTGLVC
jgi:hypothetical protein